MRILLMVFVAVAAASVCVGYSAFGKRRIAECEGFLAFLRFARGQVSCFLRPIGEWKDEFENDSLMKSGFLPAFRESGNLKQAFDGCKEKLAIPPEAVQTVDEFAQNFGKGYREDELRQIDDCQEKLARVLAAEKEEISKTGRIVNALAATISLSLVVLLL